MCSPGHVSFFVPQKRHSSACQRAHSGATKIPFLLAELEFELMPGKACTPQSLGVGGSGPVLLVRAVHFHPCSLRSNRDEQEGGGGRLELLPPRIQLLYSSADCTLAMTLKSILLWVHVCFVWLTSGLHNDDINLLFFPTDVRELRRVFLWT